ncbi:MAG TPA: T9SS type A sorting domain-containing protein [Flavisolibacter sp.]|nr:T9SS type A sorting domain-containing protein [Flavisolibacter sp.]
MKKATLLSYGICFFFLNYLNAQGLYRISPEEKVRKSSLIVEGKVVSKQSFWNASHTMIYTYNKVEVFKVFKGNLSKDTIEVVTQGGNVGPDYIEASHLLSLEVNDLGVFFCFPNTIGLRSSNKKEILYDVYSSEQGFLKYDPFRKRASSPFDRYENIEQQLYPDLQSKIGQSLRVIKSLSLNKSLKESQTLAVGISGFSPTTVNAGALLDPATNVLTINGSGFGAPSGVAAVFFDDADDGLGGNYVAVPYNSPLMISWTATTIQVKVPTKAGTGNIVVQDNTGSNAMSASVLNVNYSVMSIPFTDPLTSIMHMKEINLYNSNGSGGYTIQYSTNTGGSGVDITSSSALATFQRALTTWKETAGFNVTEGGTTTTQAVNAHDATNVIMFDNANTGAPPLADGVLAVCYSGFGICDDNYAGNQAVKMGFDIVIRNSGFSTGSAVFTFGPCPPTSSDFTQVDLETVILHELGHAIGLGHINDSYQGGTVGQINPGKLMNYAVVYSVKRTTPDYSAKAGATYLINPQSNTYGACGISEMTPLAKILEPKDDCPATFPSSSIAQGTVIGFDLTHATSNKYVDPAYTQIRCDGIGAAQTNNAYYAFTTNSNTGSLQLSVSGYTTTPASLTTCTQKYPGVPVTGFRLALYQVNSCPSAGSFPAPVACLTINGNGTLTPIAGISANTKYLVYVEGIENTKASFNLQFGGAVLPVQLTKFTGETFTTYNKLHWTTQTTLNVEKIIIQKSSDGINFQRLNDVVNETELINGTIMDPSPYSKTYYRLAITNHDKSINYSNIIALERSQKTHTTVYPNPASRLINIYTNSPSDGSYQLRLYNNVGQLMKQQSTKAPNQVIKMQVDGLPNGIYQLEVYKDGMQLESHKVLINH